MEKKKVTLREYLHAYNALEHNAIDVSVDGTGFCIAVVFGEIKLTNEALRYFADALDNLYMYDESCVTSDNDSDFDEFEENNGGRLALAIEFLSALAGYCSCSDYDKWFEGDDVELI